MYRCFSQNAVANYTHRIKKSFMAKAESKKSRKRQHGSEECRDVATSMRQSNELRVPETARRVPVDCQICVDLKGESE